MKHRISHIAAIAMIAALSTACSAFKNTHTMVQDASTGGMSRTQYIMAMEKDGSDYLEITEVKLRNSETKAVENAVFTVMDSQRQTTILNLKGYLAFSIVATINNNDLAPTEAIVVYRTEVEGDLKTKKVKPLVKEE